MYELLFWKYEEGIYLNHHEVYEKLIDNQAIEGLEELTIEIILNRINNVFNTWEKEDEFSFKNSNGVGAFHINTTPQAIMIDCYGTEGKVMDKLVDILEEFKCALYDPQIPIRYDEYAD